MRFGILCKILEMEKRWKRARKYLSMSHIQKYWNSNVFWHTSKKQSPRLRLFLWLHRLSEWWRDYKAFWIIILEPTLYKQNKYKMETLLYPHLLNLCQWLMWHSALALKINTCSIYIPLFLPLVALWESGSKSYSNSLMGRFVKPN